MVKQNNKKEFSKENKNLEIIEKNSSGAKSSDFLVLKEEKLAARKGNIIIGTLNLFSEGIKRRHEKHYKNSKFHLIADLVLLAIILGLAASLIWILVWKPKPEISLESYHQSREVISGKSEVFVLKYKHKGKGIIKNAYLAVSFPDNFVFKSAVPDNLFDKNTNVFNLGDLPEGANGEIKIIGIVYGNLGSRQDISFNLSYTKNRRNFSEINSLFYNIEGSALELSLNFPKRIYRGAEFPASVDLANKSSQTLSNIEIDFQNKDLNIIKIQDSDSLIKVGGNKLLLLKLGARQQYRISFRASSQGGAGAKKIGAVAYLSFRQQKLKQAQASQETEIKDPSLKISFSTPQKNIKLGEKAVFTLNYRNEEEKDLNDVNLNFKSGNNNFVLDGFKIKENSDFYIQDNSIIGKVGPGESGALNLEAVLKKQKLAYNQEIFLSAKAVYEDLGQNIFYKFNSPGIKILSNLSIKSGAYYYNEEGDQLGVGPLPPRVGIPTNYWILWRVDNSGNDLSDVVISAQLPKYLVWTGNKSLLAGKLLHGEIGDQVVWQLDKVSASGGNYQAWFEVSLIPGEGDAGKVMDLLTNINYSAEDEFCGETISGALSNITTDLQYDLLAKGKSKVVK